ncbi:MAG: phosphotransferase, partial [Gammaproteobacteria bacterium]
MDVLDVERADGSRWMVSLRRFVSGHEGHEASTPEQVKHEFEILRLVESAGIPAPRPILLDAEGDWFGVPSIVMTYLPGRPLFPARNIE